VVAERVGDAPTGAWVFQPADADAVVPAGRPLPVVVFLHGFTATNPRAYGDWIEHLALRGAIVIYPDYQTEVVFGQDPLRYLDDGLAGIRAALDWLGTEGRGTPDLDRVAVVGHSLGGVLAANYAAVAAEEGLPVPGVLMPVAPGGCAGCGPPSDRFGVPLLPLDAVAAETHALVVVAEDDEVVGDDAARIIWDRLDQVPTAQRDFVTLVTDRHGTPELVADHLSPQAGGLRGEVDALDWYGPWKLLDALMACAFAGTDCETALGDTPAQRDMGRWSDGRPVEELLVTDAPG
jgi:acetyl esterase/lipase